MIDVVMPQLGESVDSGTIARWHKAAGEPVAIDEPLYEVSSDKVTMEVPSLVAGYVREIIAAEGDEVAVGTVIARIGAMNEAEIDRPAERESPQQRERLSPAVRRLLREHGLDAASIAGSADDGRITKADVLARLAATKGAAPVVNATVKPAPVAPVPVTEAPVTKAPIAGASGRTVPLSRSQRLAIERLTAAQKSAVNVFSVMEVDMETVAEARVRRGLTYLPFIAAATIEALKAHERLNASLDEANAALVYHGSVHLGVAVDLAERGLVVPVVRDAQNLSLDGLAREIARLAEAARAARLGPEDYRGSTFTLTNNGAFGTLLTAPVLNAPNVAIVSTDAVELRPVIIDRAIAIRHRMYLCMTWDHRACDGSTAARFLGRIKHNLETWNWNA